MIHASHDACVESMTRCVRLFNIVSCIDLHTLHLNRVLVATTPSVSACMTLEVRERHFAIYTERLHDIPKLYYYVLENHCLFTLTSFSHVVEVARCHVNHVTDWQQLHTYITPLHGQDLT